jgi:hypothetical protein
MTEAKKWEKPVVNGTQGGDGSKPSKPAAAPSLEKLFEEKGNLVKVAGTTVEVVNKEPVGAYDSLKASRALMVKAANGYVNTSAVANFELWPIHDKMTCFVRTPKKFVKTRKVGGMAMPYVEGSYAMKVLNFIFNFQISQEIVESKLVAESVNGKKCYLGAATVKFTFFDARTEREYVRTVHASHRAYDNPATTPDDAISSALTKSWTKVGKTFGLFLDLKEEQAYEEAEDKVERGEVSQPPVKDFNFNM